MDVPPAAAPPGSWGASLPSHPPSESAACLGTPLPLASGPSYIPGLHSHVPQPLVPKCVKVVAVGVGVAGGGSLRCSCRIHPRQGTDLQELVTGTDLQVEPGGETL